MLYRGRWFHLLGAVVKTMGFVFLKSNDKWVHYSKSIGGIVCIPTCSKVPSECGKVGQNHIKRKLSQNKILPSGGPFHQQQHERGVSIYLLCWPREASNITGQQHLAVAIWTRRNYESYVESTLAGSRAEHSIASSSSSLHKTRIKRKLDNLPLQCSTIKWMLMQLQWQFLSIPISIDVLHKT